MAVGVRDGSGGPLVAGRDSGGGGGGGALDVRDGRGWCGLHLVKTAGTPYCLQGLAIFPVLNLLSPRYNVLLETGNILHFTFLSILQITT